MPLLADGDAGSSGSLKHHGVECDPERAGETAPDLRRTSHFTARESSTRQRPMSGLADAASFWCSRLARAHGRGAVSLPGGCAIGTRPVDLLLMAMEKLGAKIDMKAVMFVASARRAARSGDRIPKVTVGGTHTALMGAALAAERPCCATPRASRRSSISRTASTKWARVYPRGESTIEIEGVASRMARRHAVLPDRIEAGTYAMAVAMTGGDVLLAGARANLLQAALDALMKAGVEVSESNRAAGDRNGAGIRRSM